MINEHIIIDVTNNQITHAVKNANIEDTAGVQWEKIHIANNVKFTRFIGTSNLTTTCPVYMVVAAGKTAQDVIDKLLNKIIDDQIAVVNAYNKHYSETIYDVKSHKIETVADGQFFLVASDLQIFPDFQNTKGGFYGWRKIGIMAADKAKGYQFAEAIEEALIDNE